MKKITLLTFLLAVTFGFSQTNVTVDPNATWNGYIIAFNAADDSYAFDFGYAVADIKTTITSGTVTLQPNFKIWTDSAASADWFDNPGNPPSNPNKKVEGLSFIEDNSLVGQAVDFTGTVNNVTIDGAYEVSAFIKVLDGNAGFATIIDERVPLTAAGDFTVSVDAATTGAGTIVQYGFVVYGLIADPATEAALGSVVVASEGSGGGGCGQNDGTELIGNGSFETGDFTDWETAGGGITVVNTNPSEGTFAASLNNTTPASSSSIKSPNRGVGIICPGDEVTISFDYRGEAVAGGVLFVELFSEFSGGGASNEILNGGAPFIPNDLNNWTTYEVTTTVGANVGGGVSLLFNAVTGGDAGSVSNIFIDNVSMVIGNGLSIDDALLNTELNVYPNPTKDVWTIATQNITMTNVLVYDILGKEVISLTPNDTEVTIDASSLKDGIYITKIQSAQGTRTVKLIKN